MAPIPEKALAALNAMKALGFKVQTAKPVLKNLLKVYENNWVFIEAENYRVLADAILDMQELQAEEQKQKKKMIDDDVGNKGKNVIKNDEPEPLRTRLSVRREDHDLQSSKISVDSVCETSLKRQKFVADVLPEGHPVHRRNELPISSSHSGKTTETALPQPSVGGTTSCNLSLGQQTNVIASLNPHLEAENDFPQNHEANSCFYDSVRPKDEPRDDESVVFETPLAMIYPEPLFSPNMGVIYAGYYSSDPVRPKDEPCDHDSAVFDIPIAMIHPQPLFSQNIASQDQASYYHSSKSSTLKQNVNGSTTNDGQRKNVKETLPVNTFKEGSKSQFLCVREPSSLNEDITSANLGEVIPTLDSVDKPIIQDVLGRLSVDPNNPQGSAAPIGSRHMGISTASNQNNKESNQNGRNKHSKQPELSECASAKSHSLQELQHNFGESRPVHDINDISKGEERVRIPVVNETTSDKYPPSFNYIPRNIVYHQAFVKFSLAQIGDKDCCPDCFNDCVTAPSPCACTRETGGEFAYTLDGLLRKEFLDECVPMHHDHQKHHMFYCKDCPVEIVKNDVTRKACNGHLVRKFIKECWSKCGCSMHCGNRVVQRGITRNLQVFLTSREKGWGLRTLDELPRGAFVCEYVGEVLTIKELYGRTMQTTGNAKHTCSVLLDVDWGTKGALKDEEALCLDATFYGNVARFINHSRIIPTSMRETPASRLDLKVEARDVLIYPAINWGNKLLARCSDANLIEVPVEVETPDHHYYHLALFTIRKVEALEELTWDYGIDFNDHDYPVKAFKCRCGSRFCRDNKRRRRSRV